MLLLNVANLLKKLRRINMSKNIKITLVKSVIGRKPKHCQIVKQLGLGKMNSSVIHADIPAIRGLVNIVNYMLRVEECA
jgi:large subunit ribosomal protein L30